MNRKKRPSKSSSAIFIKLARELRVKLHEMDQKLEHLIQSHQHFYSLHYNERELDD
jgi:hypothetical protein